MYFSSLTAGKKVIFVTNNATKSRAMYKKTFDKLGIDVSEVRPLLSSLFVTANASLRSSARPTPRPYT